MVGLHLWHLHTSVSHPLTERLASECPQHLWPAGFQAEVGEGSPGTREAHKCAGAHSHPPRGCGELLLDSLFCGSLPIWRFSDPRDPQIVSLSNHIHFFSIQCLEWVVHVSTACIALLERLKSWLNSQISISVFPGHAALSFIFFLFFHFYPHSRGWKQHQAFHDTTAYNTPTWVKVPPLAT